jgi:hypothetical protein
MKKKSEKGITWSQLIKVVLLSALILLCTIISFFLIMINVERAEVTIKIIRDNLEVFITGTCALYILLFFAMKSMVILLIEENKK